METLFEQIVLTYLTHTGDTFVCPQFPIRDEQGRPWSNPDFVALQFTTERKVVHIVEVSTAYDLSGLADRINNRHAQWIDKLKSHLTKLAAIDDTWSFVVQAFVRKERRADLERRITNNEGVSVQGLEDIAFQWKWLA